MAGLLTLLEPLMIALPRHRRWQSSSRLYLPIFDLISKMTPSRRPNDHRRQPVDVRGRVSALIAAPPDHQHAAAGSATLIQTGGLASSCRPIFFLIG